MKLKRIVVLPLVVVFMLLAACTGGNSNATDKTGDAVTTGSDAAQESQTGSSTETEEEVTTAVKITDDEMKGATISYIHDSSELGEEWDGFRREFEEKYGVKLDIEQASWDDYYLKTAVAMNSGKKLDLIYLESSLWPRYANLCQPLEEYLDMEKVPKVGVWSLDLSKFFMWKGNYYGMCSFFMPNVIYYNKTMIEDAGLDDPVELYNNGEWTWENFAKIGVELTVDSDRDGNFDTYGFTMYNEFEPFIPSNGVQLFEITDDGNIKLNSADPRIAEPLQFVQDMKSGKYKFLAPEITLEGFVDRRYAMIGVGIWNVDFFAENMKDEWNIVPWPKGPSNKDDWASGTLGSWGLLTSSEYPEAALKYIEEKEKYAASKDGLFIRGKSFTPEQYQRLVDLIPRFNPQVFSGIGDMVNLQYDLWDMCFDINNTVPTILEQFEPIFQEQINNTLNQQ